MNDDNELVIQ